MPRNCWTAEEEIIAKELLAIRGCPDIEFKRLLGRTKMAAAAHFYWKRHDRRTHPVTDTRPKPSPEMQQDAARRLNMHPISITAAICGDPLPGRSALDQKL